MLNTDPSNNRISIPDEYYFTDEYLTYRTLKTKAENWQGYEGNKTKLKTIEPYTDFSYLIVDNNKKHIETRSFNPGSNWPCLVRFPEQILYLPANRLFLVETDLDYFQQFFVKGITPNLDIFVKEISYPRVIYGQPSSYEETPYYLSHSELENLENMPLQKNYSLIDHNFSDKFIIPLTSCNLLPRSNTACYSACFYDRHVAEVYAKSVCDYIQRCFDRYNLRKYYN